MGDEYAVNNPGSLDRQVNYVHNALVLGVSDYPIDYMRVYAEAAYAFNATDGAEPWEELDSAQNCLNPESRIREELPSRRSTAIFAKSMTLVVISHSSPAGFGEIKQGTCCDHQQAFLSNGKSSQYQFYHDSQQQVGVGISFNFLDTVKVRIDTHSHWALFETGQHESNFLGNGVNGK